MKQLLSIGLFASLLIPSVGAYVWLHYQKAQVRHQVKQQILHTLPKENLTLLVFTHHQASTQLQWEDEHEFEYQNHLYDVVHTKIQDNTIWYWCWDDQKETILNQQLQELIAQQDETTTPTQKTKKQLTNFLKELYCIQSFTWHVGELVQIPSSSSFFYTSWYPSHFLLPLSPPPRYS